LLLLSAVDGVGAVFCPWLRWRHTGGGRPTVRHRTRDRPQQVAPCRSARRPRCAVHGPVLTGTDHHLATVPCSVPDSAAADNAALRLRAITSHRQPRRSLSVAAGQIRLINMENASAEHKIIPVVLHSYSVARATRFFSLRSPCL